MKTEMDILHNVMCSLFDFDSSRNRNERNKNGECEWEVEEYMVINA